MVSVKTKTALISEIDNLISALSEKFDAGAGADAERDFIAERLPARLVPLSRSLPTLSMHLLAAIADAEPVSVVGLAARTNQLKGTVSKHVQRLVEAGLVERGPVPGNRKEVQLRRTAPRRRARADARGDDPRSARLPASLQRRRSAGAGPDPAGSGGRPPRRCADRALIRAGISAWWSDPRRRDACR
jgi:DNA-binding MarR family transcriptional regulator